MSETKRDVASTPVSTPFSLEPICFDVVNANKHLDSITARSDCEDFIDTIEESIDNVKKTDDVQKLHLISEVNVWLLKPPGSQYDFRIGIQRLHRRVKTSISSRYTLSFESEEGHAKALHDFSFSRHVGEKQRAGKRKRSGNTTPNPAAIVEETLSAMEDDSSADESSSEATNTKETGPIDASALVVNANGIGDLTDTEGDDFTVVARKKKVASIVIDASQNTTGLLNTLSEHLGNSLEGRFENGKLRFFNKTILEHRKLQSFLSVKKMRSHTFEMADNKQLKAVIRGLPTDYDQKEIASELKGFGGSHLTADCKKSTKSPAKCANCGGPHPANFSGCPSNPINRKQQKKQPNKNIWTEKAKERTQKSTPRQQKPTYASVTAQNTSTNNTFDVDTSMQQMGQMMQQRGTMIAFLQQNNKK
ncbi:uncharacterized protein TNCV_4685861 [Trichonephila clavipes]|nr:uncharacterized protein TNCV_4685861 [Trichonephila clavipes]